MTVCFLVYLTGSVLASGSCSIKSSGNLKHSSCSVAHSRIHELKSAKVAGELMSGVTSRPAMILAAGVPS